LIKMLTAYTVEVDEVEDALNEILGQIDLGALKKNSVGLITCHFNDDGGLLCAGGMTKGASIAVGQITNESIMATGSVMPYKAGYSGGEICPVRDESGVLQNRFHNFTFSACIL